MKVDTKAFGEIEVDERQRVVIPQGLYGFEDYKDFVLIDAEQQPFFWLQSLKDREIAFVLINPFLFRPDYEVNISNEELSEIEINSPEKAVIFAIVTIPQDGNPMTANLQGPVVVNKENMTGMQAILPDVKWKTRHDILDELSKMSK
ncbi:MAG: flagellar assembly protein FliW [Treponema sp.]|jgi:flagellar assembly factor FliW|nr:flagellar assembly protein FliW [Treponema sp.]